MSDDDDADPTMEPTCLVDLATPFAELGVEDIESNAYDQRTDSLLGTAQGTPVRCNSIYYSDLKNICLRLQRHRLSRADLRHFSYENYRLTQ